MFLKQNFEEALYAIKDALQDLVANYLDVNRQHINITYLKMDLVGEDCYDWDNNPDDACEGIENETYYLFEYQYREDKRFLDYEEPQEMIWMHREEEDGSRPFDTVMSYEEFEKKFEDKKKDPCSLMWYEETN